MTETDPAPWRRAEDLYHAAHSRSASEREAFLVAACAGDAALLADVRARLAQPGSAGILDPPAGLHVRSPAAGGSALVGRQFGGYHVEALLGVGGMGEGVPRP